QPGLKNAFAAASVRGGEVIEGRPISQINIRLGCESSPDQTREAMAETLYASIMGSGMSSRLFREIREKRGLVYGIGAGAGAMSGVGNFVIAAALDADKIDEFMMALTQQIKGSRGTITEAERQKALISFKNNYVSALEKIGSRARSLSTMFLSGQTPDLMKEYAELETITLDEINAASQRLFTKGLSLAAIGPQDKLPTLAEFTKDLS
ncbi:MAG TPA: insulinase family protein, partial [Alphaproteobacteria bacterium]|nr:insulinase family protein [Alphaproteobacteria bacterium]